MVFDPATEEELARLAKAIAHPARVRILRFLQEQTSCFAGDIVDALPLAASTVSQHLKQLKTVGLILGEIDGPRRCYCVNEKELSRLKVLIGAL
ncbi:MAG: metalloregulator ArsR/SmtB family transcription factor [Myxococcota bacterium]